MVQDDSLPVPLAQDAALPAGLLRRAEGICFDCAATPLVIHAAVNHVFLSQSYFAGLDYAVLLKVLYGVGPDSLLAQNGGALRFAADIRRFEPQRLGLYKNAKMGRGYAEYFFETLYLEQQELPDGSVIPERRAWLDPDEFVAFMWTKGVHFGVEMAAVAAAIAAAKPERITVAQDLPPTDGRDAAVVEVSQDIHRSDAPREKAGGKVDLLSFQNRFPQIKKDVRLLQKLPPVPGLPGYDMAGRSSPPAQPKDLELRHLAGEGTTVVSLPEGEFLVSTREGFLSVDPKSQRISITDKIVSTEGVSGRTTGNLQLAGAYEEYGDVQELREVNGSDITVHGNVYGNINSKGGEVVLDQNLVGGSVCNAAGGIVVKGTASSAVIQTRAGAIVIGRAENCVIAGTRVEIGEALNCEIVADDIVIGAAQGCAVAGRNVEIESAGPRKRTEMLIYVLVRDVSQFDQELADLAARAAGFGQANDALRRQVDEIAQLPDVRRYLALSARLRNQELVLTAAQGQYVRKIASAVGAELQAIVKLRTELEAGIRQQALIEERAVRVAAQKAEMAGNARCGLHMVDGDTLVRTMTAPAPAAPPLFHLPARDIKTRLRGTPTEGRVLFNDHRGALDWHLAQLSENAGV